MGNQKVRRKGGRRFAGDDMEDGDMMETWTAWNEVIFMK
jgi:hypothetical protein